MNDDTYLDEQTSQEVIEDRKGREQLALVPLQTRQINFHGDMITVALVNEQGQQHVYVLLRPLCEYLGLSWSSQLQRLREDDVLSEATTSVLLSNTEVGHRQRYTMIGLQLEFLPGWMFSFTPKRVRPDLREKITRYRRDCYRVLWNAFLRGELFPDVAPTTQATVVESLSPGDPRVVALAEQIDTLEGIVALMQEHKAALLNEARAFSTITDHQQTLLTRTDVISSQLDYVVTLLEQLVGRQETTETRVAKIDERTTHLTPQHAEYVRGMVDRIVQAMNRHAPHASLNYARVYAQVYGRFKRTFHVAKYDQVADERFEDVKTWLQEELRRVQSGVMPQQDNLF